MNYTYIILELGIERRASAHLSRSQISVEEYFFRLYKLVVDIFEWFTKNLADPRVPTSASIIEERKPILREYVVKTLSKKTPILRKDLFKRFVNVERSSDLLERVFLKMKSSEQVPQ